MEKFLNAFIERTRPQFPKFPPATAHAIASSFLTFRYGLYEKAEKECAAAITLIPDSPANASLKKALAILRAHAESRNNSQVTADPSVAFTEAELPYLPIRLPDGQNEDPASLALNNAQILVWAVALVTSEEEDEETMEEHRKLILRLLSDYKKALGLD